MLRKLDVGPEAEAGASGSRSISSEMKLRGKSEHRRARCLV